MCRAKLFAPLSTLLVLQNQMLDLRLAPTTKPCTHSVCIHASTSTQIETQRKNGAARMHTYNRCENKLPHDRKARKSEREELAGFLAMNGQFLLLMVDMIEQCRMACDERIDVTGRAAIEAVLRLSARAFSLHIFTSGKHGRWLFLEEKATQQHGFCKHQNRKCCSQTAGCPTQQGKHRAWDFGPATK